jgi:hypothetical protein
MPEQLTLNFDGYPMTNEEKDIWRIIECRRGKGNEILGPEIARRTGIDYTRVRAVIAHLINEHHKLIGSNGKGYYVPVTKEEVDEVVGSLEHRGIMIFVRVSHLKKQAMVDVMGQAYLKYINAEAQHETH